MKKIFIINLILGSIFFAFGVLSTRIFDAKDAQAASQYYYTTYTADYDKWIVRANRKEAYPSCSTAYCVESGKTTPYSYGWEVKIRKNMWDGSDGDSNEMATETWLVTRFNTIYAYAQGSVGHYKFLGWGIMEPTESNGEPITSGINLVDANMHNLSPADKANLLRTYYVEYSMQGASPYKCGPVQVPISELATENELNALSSICPIPSWERGTLREAISRLNNSFYPSKWRVQGIINSDNLF